MFKAFLILIMVNSLLAKYNIQYDIVNNRFNFTNKQLFENFDCEQLELIDINNEFELETYINQLIEYSATDEHRPFRLPLEILESGLGDCDDYSLLFYHGFKCLQLQNKINKKDNIYMISGVFLFKEYKIKYPLVYGHAWNLVIKNNKLYFFDATNNHIFHNKTQNYENREIKNFNYNIRFFKPIY